MAPLSEEGVTAACRTAPGHAIFTHPLKNSNPPRLATSPYTPPGNGAAAATNPSARNAIQNSAGITACSAA
jgi:hypothetical protein